MASTERLTEATLPTKQAGRHRWILSCVYPLEPGEAAAVAAGNEYQMRPGRLVVAAGVRCFDCAGDFIEMRLTACPVDTPYEGDQ